MKYLIALVLLISAFIGVREAAHVQPKTVTSESQEIDQIAGRIRAREIAKRAERVRANRVQKVKAILAGTPLEVASDSFVDCGDKFGVNPALLLAIAGHESSFGVHVGHLVGNAFGWNAHGGRTFSSWADGVCHVAAGLAASYDLSSVRRTITRYAPPVENDTERYIQHVESFIAQNKI